MPPEAANFYASGRFRRWERKRCVEQAVRPFDQESATCGAVLHCSTGPHACVVLNGIPDYFALRLLQSCSNLPKLANRNVSNVNVIFTIIWPYYHISVAAIDRTSHCCSAQKTFSAASGRIRLYGEDPKRNGNDATKRIAA